MPLQNGFHSDAQHPPSRYSNLRENLRADYIFNLDHLSSKVDFYHNFTNMSSLLFLILLASPLLLGWWLDLLLGDPARLPHPVVYMGKWIGFWEHRLNQGTCRMLKGAIMALLSIILIFCLTWLLLSPCVLGGLPWFDLTHCTVYIILSTLLVFFCLAGKTLRKEVKMVFEAAEQGETQARRQVARIVGRDTSQLSLQECRTAALETLAENLSDGVVAPLFWFTLLGVPGMMAYKMVNTLDSMIGYHSERYLRFGCWAARIDDAFNFIPARLTALLMLLADALTHPRQLASHLRFVNHYGPQHASPNSGWPESALASILDCRFGGPHEYFGETFDKPFIGHHERMLGHTDMKRSLRVCFIAECLCILLILAFFYLVLHSDLNWSWWMKVRGIL